jgi:hypothetical protein
MTGSQKQILSFFLPLPLQLMEPGLHIAGQRKYQERSPAKFAQVFHKDLT